MRVQFWLVLTLLTLPVIALAAPTRGVRHLRCPEHGCVIMLEGTGTLVNHARDGRFGFGAPTHFRIDYRFQCRAGRFALILRTVYRRSPRFHVIVAVTGRGRSGRVQVREPARLRWYPEVDSTCSWSFSVVT